jgi:hypothetical protein
MSVGMRSFFLRLAVFLAVAAVALELLFRTVVPASQMPASHQDPVHGIMRQETRAFRTGRHTMGRLGRPAFRWRVNNDGFNSATEYLPVDRRQRPCVAVIGNCFVQGLHSDVEDHLAARLEREFAEQTAFYNLSAAGLPLSQAPLVVAFAVANYRPDLIVIQADGDSVKRSLRSNGNVPYSRQYQVSGDTIRALPPSPFQASEGKRLLRRSALVRYVHYNLRSSPTRAVPPAASADRPDPGVPDSVYTVLFDRTLRDIVAAAEGTPLFFVFDADRQAIYGGDARPDPVPLIRLAGAACARAGVASLDLTDAFWQEYNARGRRFEFRHDHRWNPYGVGVVARAVAAELRRTGLFVR